MGWTRAELKEKAKGALKANYWWCVLTAFILSLLSGGNSRSNVNSEDLKALKDMDFNALASSGAAGLSGDINSLSELIQENSKFLGTMLIFVGFIVLFAMIIGIAVTVFLVYPLQVGGSNFFLINREGTKPTAGELLSCFRREGYLNCCWTMFKKDAFIFLWSLLLFVPGIIKAYEYRMVSYLLAEDPAMDSREALTRSREMMYGHKWDAFVLDLSFIGWNFLSALTFGILGIFYVAPYQYATNAELYAVLCGRGKTSSYYGDSDGYTSTYSEI